MIRGIYTSGLGMVRETKKLDIVSNNLANASTNAFKTQGVTSGTFKKALDDVVVSGNKVDIANYTPDILNTFTNFTQGSLLSTGNQTDLAITNDNYAFFEVANGEGEKFYTRDGSFLVDKDGYLSTTEGYKVLNDEGEYINVGETDFGVSAFGQITGGADAVIGNLSIKSFENPQTLARVGNNLSRTTDDSKEREFQGEIQQAYLEMSNVNTVNEMVDMISISRAYEANQKVLQAQDEMLGKSVNDVGRV